MASLDPQSFRNSDTLLENHQQLRAIFNQAAVGIALASLDGYFVDLNRRFSEILGYSEAELHAMTFSDLTHPDDREMTEASVRRLLAGDIPEYTLEKRYLRKGGGELWSLTTVTLMRDGAGRPLRFIGVIEDITQRKNAESALDGERRILEVLNETGKLLASQLDLQTLVQAVTDAGTKLSGAEFGAFFHNTTAENGDEFLLYTLSGVSRAQLADLGNPRVTPLFASTFSGGPPIRLDDVLADPRYGAQAPHHGMPKGHLPVRSYLAVPVKSRSGEVVGGLFFGHSQTGVFTERAERLVSGVAAQAGIAIDNARLYEAAQRAAAERTALLESERAARSAAERLSDVKDEFLATLSHELRTPLNAILGWSQVLRTGRKNEADIVRGLETIERNARVQAQLIEDLLDMSRINSGNLLLEIGTADPAAVIDAAIETVRPAADGKGIRLSRDLDPSVGSLPADPRRLQQVLWNLLSNAIKFTPRDGEARVATRRSGANLEISVTDTGIGIAPDFLPYLFERFRQGDSSTTRRFGGLGLGLSIVKSLVEMHGGSVSASSEGEGHGTTIIVRLPLRSPAAAASGDPSA
jgi:PAS domain S-box-containing protein